MSRGKFEKRERRGETQREWPGCFPEKGGAGLEGMGRPSIAYTDGKRFSGGIRMRVRRGLLWAGTALLLLWKLLCPEQVLWLRERAEQVFWRDTGERLAAWGQALGEEERIAVFGGEAAP